MPTHASGQGGRRAARRFSWIVVVFVAAMLILPTMVARAADDDPADGEVPVETTIDDSVPTDPPPVEEPAPTDVPPTDAPPTDAPLTDAPSTDTPPTSEEPLPVEPDGGNGQETPRVAFTNDQVGIYLNVFNCPNSDVPQELGTMLQSCPIYSGVEIFLYGPDLTQSSLGGMAMQAMPAGNYTLRALMPSGYSSSPVAFCGVGPTNVQMTAHPEVVVYEGYYEFSMAANQSIECYWFNLPLPQPGNATILINKHFCPSPSEFDAYDATIYELAPNCQEPATPASFAVLKNDVQIASGVSNGAPNLLSFPGLPNGPVTVVETVPLGYDVPRVFCSVKDELGNSRAPLTEATVDNDRIFWTLNAGDVVFCDWFNIPAPRGVTISVTKYTCPVHLGYVSGGFDGYKHRCTKATPNVPFKLDGASTGNPGEQTTDQYGMAYWSGLEADHYYLTEQVPPKHRSPVVYCATILPDALATITYERYPVSNGNRIEFDVEDGEIFNCTFFNRPRS